MIRMKDIIATYNDSAEEYAKSRVGTEDTDGLERFKSMLQPHARVLDVGCAAGRDTRILKDMGFDVIGSDLAKNLLTIARRENPDIVFVLADIRELPFADNSFDAIWSSAVLHHVHKTEMPKVLGEFWRTLDKDGILYVHTKAGEGMMHTKEETVGGEEREFELVTADELDMMLHEVGFTKLSLEVKESKSRKGLLWVNGFYKKSA